MQKSTPLLSDDWGSMISGSVPEDRPSITSIATAMAAVAAVRKRCQTCCPTPRPEHSPSPSPVPSASGEGRLEAHI